MLVHHTDFIYEILSHSCITWHFAGTHPVMECKSQCNVLPKNAPCCTHNDQRLNPINRISCNSIGKSKDYLSRAGCIVRVCRTSRASALCHCGLSGSRNFTKRDRKISHSVTCKMIMDEWGMKTMRQQHGRDPSDIDLWFKILQKWQSKFDWLIYEMLFQSSPYM